MLELVMITFSVMKYPAFVFESLYDFSTIYGVYGTHQSVEIKIIMNRTDNTNLAVSLDMKLGIEVAEGG